MIARTLTRSPSIGVLSAALLVAGVVAPGLSVAAGRPADGGVRDEMLGLARTSSVVGREGPAARLVRQRLDGLDVRRDALGDLVLTLGSGAPRTLLAASLDEPGLVVSRIRDDGALRVTPVGQGYLGNLAWQYLEGQKVTIATEAGPVHGAVMLPSAHLTAFARERVGEWPPFAWQDAYVDVGVESAGEVGELGIRLLDPLTLIKRPAVLADAYVAAPSAQRKAAVAALLETARRLAARRPAGTVVLAWTALGLINGKGLEAVVAAEGPFDAAWVASTGFGWVREGRELRPAAAPVPGSGVLVDAPVSLPGTTVAPHVSRSWHPTTGGPAWGGAAVHHVGLPTRYQDTPVETVSLEDVRALADLWVRAAGGDPTGEAPRPSPAAGSGAEVEPELPHAELAATLASLVSRYGVSGAEGPVRERVLELLPAWADPVIDDAGNVSVSFGRGREHRVFVAHMDETGFRVREILPDGRLELEGGGDLDWVWQGQAALVHTAAGDVPAVFEPRAEAFAAETRAPGEPLTVYLGVEGASAAEALGVGVGDTVTMPKRMLRIGTHRAVARAFDDRAGSTALLAALARIDPQSVPRRVTFAWSVGEEVGLVGARTLAERFADADVVHPVDTFVSSDSPLESDRTAWTPLGEGAVLRVIESINFVPREQVQDVLDLARQRGIPLQVGMTSGGTDGQPFLVNGTPSVPISWPGRYSHSPVEVLDFRDLETLIDLITALVNR